MAESGAAQKPIVTIGGLEVALSGSPPTPVIAKSADGPLTINLEPVGDTEGSQSPGAAAGFAVLALLVLLGAGVGLALLWRGRHARPA